MPDMARPFISDIRKRSPGCGPDRAHWNMKCRRGLAGGGRGGLALRSASTRCHGQSRQAEGLSSELLCGALRSVKWGKKC